MNDLNKKIVKFLDPRTVLIINENGIYFDAVKFAFWILAAYILAHDILLVLCFIGVL